MWRKIKAVKRIIAECKHIAHRQESQDFFFLFFSFLPYIEDIYFLDINKLHHRSSLSCTAVVDCILSG